MTSLAGILKVRGKHAVKRLISYDSRSWLRIRQIEAVFSRRATTRPPT
ncbi:hypothetical protein ABID25_004116 [Mesorhizobium abyssinicae]